MPLLRAAVPALLALASAVAAAAPPVAVSDAWIRAPRPGQDVAGLYLTIRSELSAALVGVSTPAARVSEWHEMRVDAAGVMRMRHVPRIELPPGRPVTLAPGALHGMLTGLTQPIAAGDRVPVELELSIGGRPERLRVVAEVRDDRGVRR